MKRSEFIQSLAHDFTSNNRSLYLGAGFSKNYGFPSWLELFNEAIADLRGEYPALNKIQMNANTDLYSIGEYIKAVIGKNGKKLLVNVIKKILRRKLKCIKTTEVGTNLFEGIINQEYNSIWTTNFDEVLEYESQKGHYQLNVVHLDSPLDSYHKLHYYQTLYKINGSIGYRDPKIILTKEDYESYDKINRTFLAMLKRELICNTFLFIGCSFNDGILLPILQELKSVFGDDFKHYAIFIRGQQENQEFLIRDYENRYGIYSYILTCDDNEITTELSALLQDIHSASVAKNVFISGSIPDPMDHDEDMRFIHDLVFRLYDEGYKIIGGVGQKIGYYIASSTSEYLEKHRGFDASHYLDQRFFFENEGFTREKMIKQSRHTLFLYCKSYSENIDYINGGTKKELNLSIENENTLLPIFKTKIGEGLYSVYDEIEQNNLANYNEMAVFRNRAATNQDLYDAIITVLKDYERRITHD